MDVIHLRRKTLNKSLLYVEDNDSLRSLKIDIFRDIFENVEYAVNGLEGLEKYKKSNFDLVITDINMPVMDGLDMIEGINALNSSQPIIILSAYSKKEYVSRLKKLKFHSFLSKPIEIKRLIESIDSSLENEEEYSTV